MSNNVITFNFNSKPIRVVEIDGQPWFVVRDVLTVLGMPLKTASGHPIATTAYLDYLADDEKRTYTKKQSITEGLNLNDLFVGRGLWQVTVISESGLYKLVMRSDKPEAKRFQDWLAREVLPSIRRTGAYVVGQPSIQENPKMDDLELAAAQADILKKLIANAREQHDPSRSNREHHHQAGCPRALLPQRSAQGRWRCSQGPAERMAQAY